jgi:hypothetical protein
MFSGDDAMLEEDGIAGVQIDFNGRHDFAIHPASAGAEAYPGYAGDERGFAPARFADLNPAFRFMLRRRRSIDRISGLPWLPLADAD